MDSIGSGVGFGKKVEHLGHAKCQRGVFQEPKLISSGGVKKGGAVRFNVVFGVIRPVQENKKVHRVISLVVFPSAWALIEKSGYIARPIFSGFFFGRMPHGLTRLSIPQSSLVRFIEILTPRHN